jgi:glycosyltransferase involved in cell wall biosynthesis
VFVHDHYFYVDGDTVLSEVAFTMDHWQRYLEHVESVAVVGRDGGRLSRERAARAKPAGGTGVQFHLLPGVSGLRGLARRSKVTSELDGILSKADVVVVRLPSELGLLAARVAERRRMPCVVELVGCPWDALIWHGSVTARGYAPILFYRTRRAVARADHVLYVTKRFLQSRYPSQAAHQVAASNVDISVDARVVRIRRSRIASSRSGRPLRLGFLGSLAVRYKGLHVLLRALARVRSQHGRGAVVLEVAGSGDPELWRIRAKALGVEHSVRFIGVLPGGERVLAWLDSIDVLVHPSLTEGLPRAVVEGMSRALPVLGSTAGGIPELLPDQCLHRPGDWRTLAGQIGRLSRDPKLRLDLGLANLDRARAYDREQLTARRREFYAHALRGNAG